MCFDPGSKRLFAFGDQRRGGRKLSASEIGFLDGRLPTVSSHRGCLDNRIDLLGPCLHADYLEDSLRGCFSVIQSSTTSDPGSTLRKAPENITAANFRASGVANDSPTKYQETVGLRKAVRDRLIALSAPPVDEPFKALSSTDGYQHGVMIAFNTEPKFGVPEDGVTYAVKASGGQPFCNSLALTSP